MFTDSSLPLSLSPLRSDYLFRGRVFLFDALLDFSFLCSSFVFSRTNTISSSCLPSPSRDVSPRFLRQRHSGSRLLEMRSNLTSRGTTRVPFSFLLTVERFNGQVSDLAWEWAPGSRLPAPATRENGEVRFVNTCTYLANPTAGCGQGGEAERRKRRGRGGGGSERQRTRRRCV